MRQILFVRREQDEGGCFALHRFTTIELVSRIQATSGNSLEGDSIVVRVRLAQCLKSPFPGNDESHLSQTNVCLRIPGGLSSDGK
jgi:hypothetical protein